MLTASHFDTTVKRNNPSTCRTIGARGKRCLFGTLLLLGSLAAMAVAGDAFSPDDGWRRTKHGWENVSTWGVSAADLSDLTGQRLPSFTISPPVDVGPLWHPAVIAIGVLLIGAAGLFLPTSKAAWAS